jgi:ABC-type polar amino acid transport system ATPase subunit
MEETKTIIEFHDVVKKYKEGPLVLDHLNMKFYAGKTHVICGASGAGKSTLIRCINHLEKINSGKITVDGITVNKKNEREIRKKCAMVFQSFNLFPHMTILENALLGPTKTLKKSKAELMDKVTAYFERVGLSDRMGAYPGELSGGQKQRAAIVRSLAMDPELILFDEPTSALDPEMIGEVLHVMEQLAEEGRTMIVVTHEMGFAKEAADQISFMENGKLIVTKSPDEFFFNSGSERVNQFLKQIKTVDVK